MDIKEDNEGAQSAAQTIRMFEDLDHDTEPDSGEEFVGYDEVSRMWVCVSTMLSVEGGVGSRRYASGGVFDFFGFIVVGGRFS